MMKSRRVFASLTILSCLLVVLALSVNAFAAQTLSSETEELISSCVKESGASPVSILIKDRTLFAEIQSDGNGRCNLEDVKSINDIYSVALGTELIGRLDYIDITVIDSTGAVIYDYRRITTIPQMPVAETISSELDEKNASRYDEKITLPNQNYTILSVTSEEHPVETKIAEVTVEVTNEGTATIDDLNTIFLETNKTVQRSTGTQCEVSLQNTDGEVVAYMGGNARYGTSVAWVAPGLEETFFE